MMKRKDIKQAAGFVFGASLCTQSKNLGEAGGYPHRSQNSDGYDKVTQRPFVSERSSSLIGRSIVGAYVDRPRMCPSSIMVHCRASTHCSASQLPWIGSITDVSLMCY